MIRFLPQREEISWSSDGHLKRPVFPQAGKTTNALFTRTGASGRVKSQNSTGSWGAAMIHFCLAHAAYHFGRRLPKPLRFRLQLVILALGIAVLLLQFYVLLRPKSSHYCNQPLLYNLVGSIILTFLATGLALILATTQHIPWELSATISVFGLASFAEGAYITQLTALAPQCARTTPQLYYLSMALSVASVISATFFSILGLFWLANVISPGLTLNEKAKTGICYEPVSECGCLWHI